MVPDAAWPGSDQWPWSTAPATGPVGRLGRPSASDPWGVGSLLSLGHPTCVHCPGLLGSCSPVCSLGVLCCVCGVLGYLAPVLRCTRWVCCVLCAVSRATWLLLMVRPLGVLLCVCGVLGHLAPVHRCARSLCCVACAVSWATWLLFTGVPARCVLFCVCGVLGHLAPAYRCARSVCCVACAVSSATWLLFFSAPAGCVVVCAESWATWLLFTGAPARCVALRVWCPGPLGFLFTGVPAPWVVLLVRCPGPLGSSSTVCPLVVLCCACGVLGHLAPVHRCARSVRCVVRAVSWANWLLFTCAPARCVASRVRRPGPLAGASLACVWGDRGWGLTHARPPLLRACGRGPLPTGCGCGGCGRGDPLPTRQRALLRAGIERCKGGTRAPGGGGISCLGVPCVLGWALTDARPPVHGACGPGPLPIGCGCGVALGPGCQWHLLPVPWFVVGCARFPGLRHPVADVAWHLSLCRGCGRRRGSLACLLVSRWCVAPRPVRSLSVLRSALPLPWFTTPPPGLSPPALLGCCAGHVEAGREPGSLCLLLAPAEAGAPGSLRVVPVLRPAMGLPLAVPSSFRLVLHALRWLVVCGSGHLRVPFPVPSVFWRGTWPVHRGCCRYFSGRRTPRPGPARVCMCVLFLDGSGGPASWARFSAPHLSFGRFVLLLCSAPSGLGLPVPRLFFPSVFLLPSRARDVSGFLCFPALGAPGLVTLCLLRPAPPPPPSFFFPAPLRLGFFVVSGPGCPGPLPFVAARPPPPASLSLCLFAFFFCFVALPLFRGSRRCWPLLRLPGFLFPPPCAALRVVRELCAGAVPPPPSGGCLCPAVSRVLLCGAAVCCELVCVVRGCFPVLCGAGVVLCGVLPCCFVGFVAGGLPCALSPACLLVSCGALLRRAGFVRCSVVCGAVTRCCVLYCAVCGPGAQCRPVVGPAAWPSFPVPRPPPAAPWCRCLVPCHGLLFVFCPGVRCCVVLLYRLPFGVLLFVSFLAGGALLLRSRWLVPCVVACGCWVLVAGSGCPLFFSSGVLCRGWSCLVAWACCPAVCCGLLWPPAPLCCVSCSVVLCCGAVVLVCVLSLCLRCFVALCVVLFGASLVCAVAGASRCGV